MELQARTRIGEKGRLVIPAEIREAMGIKTGDSVDVSFDNYEIRVSTIRSRIRRAQERARQIIRPGVSLSEELMAERREEARKELE
jgi:AbrB family looped-hinge helix DNA binding protein